MPGVGKAWEHGVPGAGSWWPLQAVVRDPKQGIWGYPTAKKKEVQGRAVAGASTPAREWKGLGQYGTSTRAHGVHE